MVVQMEAHGLEARFWITSELPTTRNAITSRALLNECLGPSNGNCERIIHSVAFRWKVRVKDELAARDSDTANKVLKSGILSQRVESGIHPDPRYSS